MEELNKSLDSLIDELFAEAPEAEVKKSMIKDEKPQKETADEAVRQAPKSEKDESRGAGRPKQISDVPQTDTDGERAGKYDSDLVEKETDADAKKKEDAQVEVPSQMKKSWEETSEYQEYLALKKAKEQAQQAEILEKARKEQTDLIKSAVIDATSSIRRENEELRKSLSEQAELIKAIANKPQKAKAITSVQAVEKFQKSEAGSSKFSKAEILDVAEELQKSKKLTLDNVIELENTGFIYDQEARAILERELKRRS